MMHWDSIENKTKTFIESQCGQSSGQTQPIDCFDFVMTTRWRCHRTELHKRQFLIDPLSILPTFYKQLFSLISLRQKFLKLN
jgi:hypothetical protein